MKILFIIIALVATISIIGAVHADHQFEPGVSGFAKAQLPNRQSITVCNESAYALDLPAIIAPWNRIAGWQLFAIACPGDITFVTSGSTWVQPYPTYREPYTSCTIYVSFSYATTYWMRHEIGHCLGFADHIYASLLSNPNYINPRVCDDPAHPLFSSYRGVMSYCASFLWWFYRDDCRMLQDAGYSGRRCF